MLFLLLFLHTHTHTHTHTQDTPESNIVFLQRKVRDVALVQQREDFNIFVRELAVVKRQRGHRGFFVCNGSHHLVDMHSSILGCVTPKSHSRQRHRSIKPTCMRSPGPSFLFFKRRCWIRWHTLEFVRAQ